MTAEEKVRGLLDVAARAVLIDLDELRAAIAETERHLPKKQGLDRALAEADIEMAWRVLTYTAAYGEVLKDVTRNYRKRIVLAGAVADAETNRHGR